MSRPKVRIMTEGEDASSMAYEWGCHDAEGAKKRLEKILGHKIDF